MRSKAPLALMEQLIMILVFALAAALCLQVFVFSDRLSAKNEQTDRAVLACQNAAETLKAVGRSAPGTDGTLRAAAPLLGGTFSGEELAVYYDENWLPTTAQDSPAYLLRGQTAPSPVTGLCQAELQVTALSPSPREEALFRLTVAWQEVGIDG